MNRVLNSIGKAVEGIAAQMGLDFGAQPPPAPAETKGKAHWVQLGAHAVPYTLKRGKRRTIGFTVGLDGLSVSAPRWTLIIEIEAALKTRQTWILDKIALMQAKKTKLIREQQRWAHGASLPYLGKEIHLNLGSGTATTELQLGMFDAETLFLALPEDASESQIQDTACAWLQTEAKRLFAQRIPVFEAQLGVKVAQWRLSSAQGRWGSASSNGHVRLHWRLVHFAPDVIDYVIAHELAHLREMNHSPQFWAVVESAVPNYLELRDVLKDRNLRGMNH